MTQSSAVPKAVLGAVVDRIVPPDADPGGTHFGADAYVAGKLGDGSADICPDMRRDILAGLSGVDQNARSCFGSAFPDLAPDRQDLVMDAVSHLPWFETLTRLVAEGMYANPGNGGNRHARGWRMVGYQHGIPEGPDGPPGGEPRPVRRLSGDLPGTDYDVIVAGAGASGGIAACVLAEAGKRVLLIEQGREHSYANSGYRDHLRNHRYSRYGHNTGPDLDGHPRVFVDADGRESIVRPNAFEYSNVAAGAGSATLVYGGLAWRFLPDDFRMASRYGIPDGSSLADWPITHDELDPFYERAEWEIGVAGESGALHGRGRQAYPMSPGPSNGATAVLRTGADRMGFTTFAPPLLINTRPRDGRAGCIRCGSCVGFPCPSDAKNGVHNTVLKRALATGRCDLVTGAAVTRIDQDSRGKPTGVTYVQADEDGMDRRHSVRSKAVMLCCGAIETARLLLLSRSSVHPAGLGNGNDLVGRNLQGHYYPTAFGLFGEDVHDSRGPGVSIATTRFNHGNEGVIGGAMLADDFVNPPIMFWEQALPPEMPRWGTQPKDFMRCCYRRVAQIKGPVQEIPSAECRVTLGPSVRDRLGLPVARLSGVTHAETVRTAAFILDRAHDWLLSAGASKTWGGRPVQRLSANHHQAGTCRMGRDPASSVTDPFGRVWGHDNLFVSDASLHPTNGGFNPVLTIMALAFRNAEHVQASL